jgi:predicted enzyme related to lactoylglutathione lyase
MERVTGVGGVFFRAKGPSAALLAWYRDHLGIEPAPDFEGTVFRWGLPEGTTTWAIFPSDTEYFGRPDQAFMVNLRVADLDRMLDQLRRAGVEVDPRVEDSEYGRFGWVTDPEGNRIELWQPAPGL